MTDCFRYRIHGRVQGVWFRESARKQAEQLGITGYAVNFPDGTVDILACGEEDSLKQLESWLRHGPPLARVHKVEKETSAESAPAQFVTG